MHKGLEKYVQLAISQPQKKEKSKQNRNLSVEDNDTI
jgi:hypothetical protein